jgi:triacylglycerol lipase
LPDDNNILTPMEASHIASNSYFALKDWMRKAPVADVETYANVKNCVLGTGNTSLKGTELGRGHLQQVFSGTTGMGVQSGFGYVLKYRKGGLRQIVIATRGTRPELGAPDLLTDLRAGMTPFGDFGPVHKGFKKTFESVMTNISQQNNEIMNSDVVHCVGHSLGGAVATLVAAHFARLGKAAKLYTFGSPRVGAAQTFQSLHSSIGKDNIFRTAHDLDPISLVGPFPYIHVNPSPSDPNNFTLPSPTGSLFSIANHDMKLYIDSVGSTSVLTWTDARALARRTDHENCVLAKWLLHEDSNPGWVQYASAKTLGILFKLFAHVLATQSTSLILGLSAVDLLAEMLMKGLYKAAALGEQVYQLLHYAAKWAGIKVAAGANFTAEIIGRIFDAMLATLKSMALHAISTAGHNLVPLPLIVAGGGVLTSGTAI